MSWLTPLKLTLKRLWNFFSDLSGFFKLLGMIETLFTNLWSCGCCLRWRWWWWISLHCSWKRTFCANWITCSWYWLLESFRRHYEGPLTEDLLKIQWMIEKLIQDNVVVMRTIRSFCQKIKFVLLRDEVECCASAGSACEENWYSSIAMVDEWNASVLSACFRSPLQFNCKLVCYCNIWLSCWTPLLCFPRCIPSRGFLTYSQVCGTLTEIGPWSLGRTSGTITVSVCEHCYVHFDDNIWFWFSWLLWEDVGCVGLLLKSCHILVYSAFSNSNVVGLIDVM